MSETPDIRLADVASAADSPAPASTQAQRRTRTAPTARRGGVWARRLWGAAGLAAFALGAAGAVLPVLPTTPFILLAAFCFARSSERIDAWFHGTRLYHLVFSSYLERRSMTLKAKLALLVPVTALMALGFALTGAYPALRVVIAVVWVGHIAYFGFVVKTEGAGADPATA